MARPFSKTQLMSDIHKERSALETLLDGLEPTDMEEAGVLGDWSVKDVLAHLIEWERMVRNWYEAGERGETPCLPAEGYKWNQLPALNEHIYEKYRDRPLPEILSEFAESYRHTCALIDQLPEEVLFTRGHFAWAGNNAMASYLNSCTASHYRWARQEIQKGLKAMGLSGRN